jgi:hypothetical protein
MAAEISIFHHLRVVVGFNMDYHTGQGVTYEGTFPPTSSQALRLGRLRLTFMPWYLPENNDGQVSFKVCRTLKQGERGKVRTNRLYGPAITCEP